MPPPRKKNRSDLKLDDILPALDHSSSFSLGLQHMMSKMIAEIVGEEFSEDEREEATGNGRYGRAKRGRRTPPPSSPYSDDEEEDEDYFDDESSSDENEEKQRHSTHNSGSINSGNINDIVQFSYSDKRYCDPTYPKDANGDPIPRRVLRRTVPIPPAGREPATHPDDARPEVALLNAIEGGDERTVKAVLEAHRAQHQHHHHQYNAKTHTAGRSSAAALDLSFAPHDEPSNTPLAAAIRAKNLRLTELLVAYGCDVNAPLNESKWTPLILAADGGDLATVRLLRSAGADVLRTAGGNFTILHAAARAKGDAVELVRYLLEQTKAAKYVSMRDCDTMTPLCNAAESGNMRVCKYLRLRGRETAPEGRGSRYDEDGDEDEEDYDDDEEPVTTALHCAAKNGHYEVCDYLLASNHDCLVKGELEIYVTDDDDCTPLHLAVMGGHDLVARLLIEEHANPNTLDIFGRTPLHIAASHPTKSAALTKALFSIAHEGDEAAFPINVRARNFRGETALDLANAANNREAATIIEHYMSGRKSRRGYW